VVFFHVNRGRIWALMSSRIGWKCFAGAPGGDACISGGGFMPVLDMIRARRNGG
jgi:hypothetical protein